MTMRRASKWIAWVALASLFGCGAPRAADEPDEEVAPITWDEAVSEVIQDNWELLDAMSQSRKVERSKDWIGVPPPTPEQVILMRDILEPPAMRNTNRAVRSVRGRVVDETGAPIVGATVQTQRAHPGITKYHWERAVTDETGGFDLACGLSAEGSLDLHVLGPEGMYLRGSWGFALDSAASEKHVGALNQAIVFDPVVCTPLPPWLAGSPAPLRRSLGPPVIPNGHKP
jgi:hypothetical protein